MNKNRKLTKEINNWIFSILGACLIAVLINSKVFATVIVEQSSMENTLYSGQKLILDKLSYNFVDPKRKDIIIFLENEERGTIIDDAVTFINNINAKAENNVVDKRLVKRVIGIPGDKINIKDGFVYINGEKLNESYAKGQTFTGVINFPLDVPNDKLFVLGDNRTVSKDSREFGLIKYNQVEGKVAFRFSPLKKIGIIK
jgi:signal peptidase I